MSRVEQAAVEPATAEAQGALHGIRVLDLSQWQQGPYATMLLGDLGADVIKVEKPGVGDAGRHGLGGFDPDRVAPDFFAHNRGKRGVTLELSHPEGQALLLRLVESADVLVHNFRHGVMEAWGLGYQDVRSRNPRLVYAHASGAGPDGPRSGQPMFDIIAQAMGGIMAISGDEGTPPRPVGTFMADQVGATMLAVAILGALVARERTGRGQRLEVSLLGSQIALQSYELTDYLITGTLPRRAGRGHSHAGILWNTFPAADGHFAMAGVREDRWRQFCAAIGAPALADDPCYASPAAREEHRAALLDALDVIFRRQPVAYWTRCLDGLVAIGRVQDYAEVARDDQVLANGYLGEMEHHQLGRVRYVPTPIAYSQTPVRARGAEPVLGQHTEEVLLEAGLDWPEILALRDAGAI